ncbi:MgtC/SapB family protein [Microbacterium sp. YY-01]|uniref:MgtC/SapB family protein n=1 Tax=Microbacterium sp. YY-01 TaxID=3421634 RepID=UPI003D17CC1E
MGIEWIPLGLRMQAVLMALAFVLSLVIGVERQWQRKHAGIRTHVLVGVGSALFTLVSAHGFPYAEIDSAAVDPSRIAAQVVSGIGFLGAGVIFVRQDIVSGLTTAASIWMAAAVGMACGAGMPTLAGLGVVIYMVTTTVVPFLRRRMRVKRLEDVRVTYKSGTEVLHRVLALAAELNLQTTLKYARIFDDSHKRARYEAVFMFTKDRKQMARLVMELSSVPGILSVTTLSDDDQG